MNNSSVSLTSYTQDIPVMFDDTKPRTLQELIEYYARVSNPAGQNHPKEPGKLINYLIKHKHWSPFEMVGAVLEINTTRDIARQILRHRSFKFQEFSQRYADPTSDLAFSTREARLQDPVNRQNSLQTDDDDLQRDWLVQQESLLHEAKIKYKWALDKGIAKEQARALLPEGLTNSRLYMNGDMRSWITYIETRTTPGTQLEHVNIAKKCAEALRPVFPMIEDFVRS